MENNKQKYIEFCKNEKNIPIFSQPWYLDAVCGKNGWDVIIVEKNNIIIATLPYQKYNRYIFKGMVNPKLTPRLGVFIKYPNEQKYTTKLTYEMNVISEIIDNMPKVDLFSQNFSCSFKNWLPFYWRGFQQTVKYTYTIDTNLDLENIYNNMAKEVRRHIKKAEKFIEIYEDDNIELFHKIQMMTFERQNKKCPFDLEFLKNYDNILKNNNSRKIFFAKDIDDNIHCASYIVWDTNTVYGLMTGNNNDFRNSGANSLMLWHIIKYAKINNKDYDYCGSVIETIERFCRGFGLQQKPYYVISKEFTNKYYICKSIVNLIRRLNKG